MVTFSNNLFDIVSSKDKNASSSAVSNVNAETNQKKNVLF